MSKRIWKFELMVTDRQTLVIPVGAYLLDVQVQDHKCCLWALCDEDALKENRHIAIYGTGQPLPDQPGQYVATFQMHDGALVFHVFEL